MALPYKVTFSVIFALLFGVFGLSMVFSDLGPGEAWWERVLVATFFFFFCGLAVGWFNPRFWIIAGLSAWGGILMGGLLILASFSKYGTAAFGVQEPPYISAGLMVLFLPLTFSLVGGYVGKLIGQRMAKAKSPASN